MKIAVLDIGGTTIKSGMYEDGILKKIKETPTDARRGGSFVVNRAKELLRQYLPFDRIGISTAGQVDSEKGMIQYANSNIPGYTGVRIKEIFEEEFQVPVAVENDVNAAAFGEGCFGAGTNVKDFLCLTYGTGIGGAIVLNKKIYTGNNFSAGEFGAIVVHAEERNPEKDLFSGCYERYASTTALIKNAMRIDRKLNNGRIVFEHLHNDDVLQVVEDWIKEIVYGLVTIIHIFNPSCIILGGGIMSQPYVLTKIRKLLIKNIMPSFCKVEILQAKLGNTAGLMGIAKLAEELNTTELS